MIAESEDGTAAGWGLRTAASDLFSRERLLVFGIVLSVEVAMFTAAAATPLSSSQLQDLGRQAQNLRNMTQNQSFTSLFILLFTHNSQIALAETIPVFGAIFFQFSIFVTGQIAAALALSNGIPQLGVVVFLLSFPYTYVEFSAYALAVTSGMFLIVGLAMGRIRSEAKVFLLELGGIVLLLSTAAAMETATTLSAAFGWALWVPMALALAWGRRRLRRSAP